MNVIEFSKRQLLLAHVFDIPVRIDYRWFGVLILISTLTAVNIPVELVENFFARFVLALISTLVFFASILFHELAHAFVARLRRSRGSGNRASSFRRAGAFQTRT